MDFLHLLNYLHIYELVCFSHKNWIKFCLFQVPLIFLKITIASNIVNRFLHARSRALSSLSPIPLFKKNLVLFILLPEIGYKREIFLLRKERQSYIHPASGTHDSEMHGLGVQLLSYFFDLVHDLFCSIKHMYRMLCS